MDEGLGHWEQVISPSHTGLGRKGIWNESPPPAQASTLTNETTLSPNRLGPVGYVCSAAQINLIMLGNSKVKELRTGAHTLRRKMGEALLGIREWKDWNSLNQPLFKKRIVFSSRINLDEGLRVQIKTLTHTHTLTHEGQKVCQQELMYFEAFTNCELVGSKSTALPTHSETNLLGASC